MFTSSAIFEDFTLRRQHVALLFRMLCARQIGSIAKGRQLTRARNTSCSVPRLTSVIPNNALRNEPHSSAPCLPVPFGIRMDRISAPDSIYSSERGICQVGTVGSMV